MKFPPVEEQMRILLRGCEAVYSEQELRAKLERSLAESRPLRVKLGMDPSAPDIHLGHSVVLRKLRQFQDLGHKAVLIIGDYTAMIGDPTGRNRTRPMLTREQVEENARTYFQQAGRILRTDPASLEIRRNSEWLEPLKLSDALRLASKMTVARMLERDTFAKRFKAGVEIYLHEFMYPLLQGYDSVAVKADVELGGTDQTFNNLVGRDLQRDAGQEPQVVMTLPLLVGIDGREKMSKSLGNYIGLTDSPKDMFGKTMRIPDDLMRQWFTLLTDRPAEEIERLCDPARTHPRQAKATLAMDIVRQYYDEQTARYEAEQFDKVFKEGKLRDDIPEVELRLGQFDGTSVWLPKLLQALGLVASSSEGKRLIQQGAVSIDGQRLTDPQATVPLKDGMIVKAGKRRVAKVRLVD